MNAMNMIIYSLKSVLVNLDVSSYFRIENQHKRLIIAPIHAQLTSDKVH